MFCASSKSPYPSAVFSSLSEIFKMKLDSRNERNLMSKILEVHQRSSALHLCPKQWEEDWMCCSEKGYKNILKSETYPQMCCFQNDLRGVVCSVLEWATQYRESSSSENQPMSIFWLYECLPVHRPRKSINLSLRSWTSFLQHPLMKTRFSKGQKSRRIECVRSWKCSSSCSMFCCASLQRFRRHRAYVPSRARVGAQESYLVLSQDL
jgi:hypothetical protein